MTSVSGQRRSDSASRVIRAEPRTIYRAFLNPEAVAAWRPPEGMKCEIYEFDPHEGGTFRMAFVYKDTDHRVSGKTSEHADIFQGRFAELIPDERIVELIEFDSTDPEFGGTMTITTSLAAVPGGTEVTILCENVPRGINPDDHQEGISSSLNNLAAFTE